MDFYKQSKKEQMRNNELLQFVHDWAVELGIDPAHTNPSNIKLKLNKTLKDGLAFEAKAKELGYSSLGNALKALSMMAERPGKWDISTLPQVYHRPPMIWLQGRKENKRKDIEGSAPMAVRHAERRHRTMMPLLLEAWALIDGDPEEVEALEYNYLIGTPNEYERFLYELIYNLEPIPLEEEFDTMTMPTPIKDPDVEAMVAVVARDFEGQEVSSLYLEQLAISRINKQKRCRR
jgi:hypothetical protein